MNLSHLLLRAARASADRTALAVGPRPFATYGELATRAASLGSALTTKLGLKRGDRVALLMRNCPEYIECLFASWHVGLVAVPVNARLLPAEVAHILADSGASALFFTGDLAANASAALARVPGRLIGMEVQDAEYRELSDGEHGLPVFAAPDDPAWLFYTSGTTGKPKGATLTHRNLLTMTTTYFCDVDAIAPNDGLLHAAPMSHGSGLYILPHVAAMACQIVPEGDKFDPAEIFDLLGKHDGVSMFAAPTMVNRLVAAGGDAPGLKTIIYGGGPMYVEDSRRALDLFGPRLAQIYGQGETPMTITALSKRDHEVAFRDGRDDVLASVGRPQTAVEVIVADESGHELPTGKMGEILVRGDTVMSGYWMNDSASAEALAGGWLHTGDLGSFAPDGLLTLRDRSKDVIISGGSNIYPREVEEALLRHPGIREVAVVGRRDAEWGETPVAVVVPSGNEPIDSAVLDQVCNASIARYKRPSAYIFVTELPKNAYGKVLKRELRKLVL